MAHPGGLVLVRISVAYRPTIGQPLSVDISTDISVACQSTYRPMLDRYVGRYIERHISVEISTNTQPIIMSTDISIDTRLICRLIRQSTVGRYVDRYVSRGVHKIIRLRQGLQIQKISKVALSTLCTASHNHTLDISRIVCT